jgi:hypothetical protein
MNNNDKLNIIDWTKSFFKIETVDGITSLKMFEKQK